MVFYIHDQGLRVQTPVDRLLAQPLRVTPAQRVQPVSSQRIEPVSAQADAYRQVAGQQDRQRARTAADIMHRPVISISSLMSIDDAWALFARHRIHHLPVIDDGHLRGIVSDRDLLRAALNGGAMAAPQRIADVMSSPVITATADTAIRLLAEVMVRQRIGVLPVIDDRDGNERVSGIVTRSDLLRLMVDEGSLELWI